MPTPGLVIGVPAKDSTLLEIVTLLPPETLMAFEPVFVIVNPEMVMLFRLEMANALVPPLMVTPGFAVNVTPEFRGLTAVPGYVPAWTSTVSPAAATFAAPAMVQNGCAGVPGPEAPQVEDVA